jgi:hypothetical protein
MTFGIEEFAGTAQPSKSTTKFVENKPFADPEVAVRIAQCGATQLSIEHIGNWTAQHNEVAMLLFVLIPWMLLNIFRSALPF